MSDELHEGDIHSICKKKTLRASVLAALPAYILGWNALSPIQNLNWQEMFEMWRNHRSLRMRLTVYDEYDPEQRIAMTTL